jgi:UDP-glucose 4-epimerase
MRVLLTGATGFVGGEIRVALEARGHEVVLASRQPLSLARENRRMPDLASLDIAEAEALLEGTDALIHAAGYAHAGRGADPARHASVNARGTAVLAAATAKAGARLVFLSSIKAMGAPDAEGYLREAVLREPEDAYGLSKRDAERAIRTVLPDNHVILRPALVAGPGAKGNLAALLRLARWPVPLPFQGVTARRSMISLADLAEIAARAVSEPGWAGRSMIVADPEPLAIGEIVAAMRAGMARDPRLFSLPEGMLATLLRLSGRADWAERLFSPLIAEPGFLLGQGWRPATPVAVALRQLVQRHSG